MEIKRKKDRKEKMYKKKKTNDEGRKENGNEVKENEKRVYWVIYWFLWISDLFYVILNFYIVRMFLIW